MNKTMDSVKILGARVDAIQKADLISYVFQSATQTTQRVIFYVNANCLNIACSDSVYHNILNQADLVYPDGIGVVWASRWLRGPRLEKLTGRDWLTDICKLAEKHQLSFYFLAGRPGVAARAADIIRTKHPGVNIHGTADGYFIERRETDVIAEILVKKPHILFVGMGSPIQEKWIASHQGDIQAKIIWGVGALFDTVTGIEPPVPGWLNSINLEWFWRFIVDPRGKWQRYLIGNPQFIFRVLQQKLSHG